MEHYQNERFFEAERLATSISREFPMHQFAWKILGAVFKQTGRISESITYMQKSLQLNPLDAEAHNNYGVILQELGRLEEAEASYTRAIKLEPNYIEANNNLGNLYKDQEKYEKAIIAFNKVILVNPNNAEVYYNKGVTLKKIGKLEESILMYTKAVELNPQYTNAYNNLGNALRETGAKEQAIHAYKKSILLKSDFADAHLNLSFALLSYGSYQEGLDEYEWRWKTDKFLPKYRQFSQPLWKKETPLNGKTILIWSEQGVGDTITWSSCVSYVASQAKHCILECQGKLVPLLKRSFPNIEVKAEDRSLDNERNDFDFHISMGSLYKNLSAEIFQKTKIEAYLTPDRDRVNYWKKRLKTLGNGPFIGVSWKSIVMSPDRLPNYASISDWFPLFRLPNIKFINLQPKDFKEDLSKIKNEFGVKIYNFDELDHFDNIHDVAALCSALDIVVSTKTTLPLISAGVGTSTKLANWKQSSWNNILLNPRGPSVDIYERDTCQPWDNIFSSIAEDVLNLTKKKEE